LYVDVSMKMNECDIHFRFIYVYGDNWTQSLVRHKILYVQLPLHLKGIPENFACLLIYHMEIRMSCQHFDRTICKELSPILTKNITSKRLSEGGNSLF
jgi:hypothetical protein